MAWRTLRVSSLKKFLVIAITFCFLVAVFLGTSSLPSTSKGGGNLHNSLGTTDGAGHSQAQYSDDGHHRIAVIVPFRDRFEELLTFAPFIHRYLTHKNIPHDIVVVNQVDTHRFNRASLINVGFNYATSSEDPSRSPCDYIAMHDVDLLPLNNDLPYAFPEPNSVTHVAAPGLHPKYNYPSFIGGILIVSSTIFRFVNGMSNLYWGWGLEDDEFYVRLKQNNIQVIRPSGIATGQSNTFRHSHSPRERPRDFAKCYDQYNKTRRRDRLTGLNNANYTLHSISHLTIDEAPLVILNVQLHCNTELSPWCDCSKANKEHNGNSVTNSKTTKNNNAVKMKLKPSILKNNSRVRLKETGNPPDP